MAIAGTRRAVRLAIAALVLPVAACGTAGGRSVDVRALMDSDRAGASSTSSSSTEPTGTTVVSGTEGSSATTGALAAPGQKATATTARGKTPAVAALKPLQVGVFYPSDGGAAYAAFGVKNNDAQSGDPSGAVVRALQAMAKDINARGGLGGHKMELVFHGAPLIASDTWASQGQAACSDFTEDHHVFAALLMMNGTLSTSECIAGRHVIVLESRSVVYDKAEYTKTGPYVYSARGLNISRQGAWLDEIWRAGYFGDGARVGVVTMDDPVHSRAMTDVVRPTLARHGQNLVEVGLISPLQATADVSQDATQLTNLVLRFKVSRVSHVVFVSTQGVAPFFFPGMAEAQGYHPRYGISSADYPDLSRNQGPVTQWHGAMGAGWIGPGDVGLAPNWVPSDAAKKCLRFFAEAGLPATTGDTTNALLGECDSFALLKAGMDRATAATPEAFRAAVDTLGTSFVSVAGTPNSWGPGKHDGAAAVRAFGFKDGCGCFAYTSPTWTPAP